MKIPATNINSFSLKIYSVLNNAKNIARGVIKPRKAQNPKDIYSLILSVSLAVNPPKPYKNTKAPTSTIRKYNNRCNYRNSNYARRYL